MKRKNLNDLLIIAFVSIFSSLLISLYYYLFPPANLETHVPHGSNEVLERNYDGPIYVAIAQTFYNPEKLKNINFNKLPIIYFANHFPLFPLLIKAASFIIKDSFRSLILLTWFFTAAYALLFYKFLQKFKISSQPLLLTLVSLFVPPRFWAVRTVGGTEPLFMFLIILLLYLWFEKKYLLAGFLSILLVLTRPPGILLFFGFLAIIAWEYLKEAKNKDKLLNLVKKLPILVFMPLTIFGLFLFYKFNFGDFFVYFKTNTGTNIHLMLIPFAATIKSNSPVVEGFIYTLLAYAVGVYLLWKQKQEKLALFSLVYLLPNFFMYVDDIHRYLVPIAPLCLIIGYQNLIKHKAFKYFFIIMMIGSVVYTLNLLPLRMFAYWDYADLRLLK